MSKLLRWRRAVRAGSVGAFLFRVGGRSRRVRQAIAAGDAARESRRYGEAARHYRAALERDPTLAAIEVQYGHMLKKIGDWRGSEAAYERALRQSPEEPDTDRQLGPIRKLPEDRPGAFEACSRAFDIDPTLGDLQAEMEQVAARLDAVDSALLQAAGDADGRRDCGQADDADRELVCRRPGLSTLWVRCGIALAKAGRRFPALRAFQRAVALRLKVGDGWLHLGRALAGLGERAAARASYGRVSLRPSSRQIPAELAGLDRAAAGEAPDTGGSGDDRRNVGEGDAGWPRFGDAGLPPRLHELLARCYGEDVIPRYGHLMGVVAAFADEPSRFRAAADASLMLDRMRSAALRLEADGVRASIVIPVFDNLVYTLTCIASILEHGARVPFEIIVGDDRSSDETAAVLTGIGGCVRVVRHAANLGFLHNCNRTAEVARGEIIVMLNNDTLVLPGWLDAMIGTFAAYPGAGFVGSKMINGEGTLQEAGGIVWRDGSGWNFGRNADPSWPEYNYVKEVDYVSGASIAVPRALWDRLGGFDPVYAPGYCEDSDLAFRVRAAGHQTLYQPSSAVIHHEGRSHGRDIAAGIKSYQRVNRQTLRARWQTTLAMDHLDRGEDVFVARDRSRWKPHILFISGSIPACGRDAGSRRLIDYLTFFRDWGFQVTLWPDDMNEDGGDRRRLQDLGIEVLYSQAFVDGFPQWFDRRGSWIDYAFVSRPPRASSYLETLAGARTRVLFDGGRSPAGRDDDPTAGLILPEHTALETSARSPVILASSAQEADDLRGSADAGRPVAVVPIHIVSDAALEAAAAKLEDAMDRADPHALLFIGAFGHAPNVDALAWLVTQVMPLVRQRNPAVRLRVAGSHVPQAVADLASDDVTILGHVGEDELRDLYGSSAVAVIPVRHGAGVRGKLIEAFANGTPVVSTSLGVQGIPEPRSMAFVGDDPSDFARQVLLAITDRAEALRRARRAVAFLREHYTEASAVEGLAPYVPELRGSPARSGGPTALRASR